MKIKTTTYLSLRQRAPIVACVSAALMVLGMFFGWFRSGARMRNSFELFRIPQQLGLDGFTEIRLIWFLLPVMGAAVGGFLFLGRRPVAAGILTLQSLIGLLIGGAVLFSDLETGMGPLMTAVGAIGGFGSAVVLAVTARPTS